MTTTKYFSESSKTFTIIIHKHLFLFSDTAVRNYLAESATHVIAYCIDRVCLIAKHLVH